MVLVGGLADAVSMWFRRKAAVAPRQFEPTPYPALVPTGMGHVTLASAESAMQSIAVGAAVDLIASLSSELPLDVVSGSGEDLQIRTRPGYLDDPGGDGQGLADWSYQALVSWLLRGNLYGDVLDERPGYMTQIALQHPDDVHGWIEDGAVRWTVAGRPVTDTSRWLHRRVRPVPGRVLGLSPIEWHASNIGLAITSVRFGEQWFRDGAHPSALLTNEEADLSEDQARRAKHRFLAALRGTREPVVLGKGWKYQQIQISPEESQFLATQGYTEAQCARIFGPGIAEALGYETGTSMTYTNVETKSRDLLVYSVNKWLLRLERLLSGMLPRPQRAVIDREGILQSTALEKWRVNEVKVRTTVLTVNEIRKSEGLRPVPWGDKPAQLGPAKPAADDPDDDKDGKA